MYDMVLNQWLHDMARAGCIRKDQRSFKIHPAGALTRPLNPKNNRRQRGK